MENENENENENQWIELSPRESLNSQCEIYSNVLNIRINAMKQNKHTLEQICIQNVLYSNISLPESILDKKIKLIKNMQLWYINAQNYINDLFDYPHYGIADFTLFDINSVHMLYKQRTNNMGMYYVLPLSFPIINRASFTWEQPNFTFFYCLNEKYNIWHMMRLIPKIKYSTSLAGIFFLFPNHPLKFSIYSNGSAGIYELNVIECLEIQNNPYIDLVWQCFLPCHRIMWSREERLCPYI